MAKAERQVSMGLIHEDDALVSKLGVERAASDLKRSLVDLEEVKASGKAPRNELYAPAVGGRDFVSERLEIDKRTLEVDLGLRRGRTERNLKEKVDLGLIPKSGWEDFQASLAVQEAEVGDIEKRLDLRRRLLAGEISAEEMEIQDRTTAAERDLRQARSSVASFQRRLELLRAKQAVGVISESEIQGYQFALDAAQAELNLALQQIDILKKLK
jgi:hypothetical protein